MRLKEGVLHFQFEARLYFALLGPRDPSAQTYFRRQNEYTTNVSHCFLHMPTVDLL